MANSKQCTHPCRSFITCHVPFPIHLAKTSTLRINLDPNRSFGPAIPWLPCPPIQRPPTTPTRPPLLEHRRHPFQQLPLLPSHLHLQLQHPLLPHPPTQQPTHIRHIPCTPHRP